MTERTNIENHGESPRQAGACPGGVPGDAPELDHREPSATPEATSGDAAPEGGRHHRVSTGRLNRHGAYICRPCSNGTHADYVKAFRQEPTPLTPTKQETRIRELEEALSDALARVPADDERDRLVAVLAGLGSGRVKRGCPCDDGDGEGCPVHGFGAP